MSRDALVVGINDYHYMQPLKSPSQDAEAIASILEQFGDFSVKRLPEAIDQETNQICVAQNIPVSLDELEKALVQLFKPTGSGIPDTALFFFSGHGLRRDLGIQEGFLCTSETASGSGMRGLSLQWLRRLILESEVRQQVIMLDCCYSGELFNLTEADPGHLGRGRDRCFIAASREFELAYEETAGDHGIFTRALLDGLNPSRPLDGMVNNTELSDFIAKQLTGTVQKPIFSNSGGAIILIRAVRPLPVPKKSKGTVCPYRGLSYFDCNEEDPKYFYGRAALTDQLIEKVRQSNFVAVLGPSGSGKSSVVRAGLLHQLKVGRKLSDSETWPVHMFRPGEHPLKSLAMAFVNSSLSNIEVAAQLDKAEELIAKGAVGLDRLVRGTLTSESSSKESSTNGRVVLVADQFEEVFSLCRDENERDQFFECLLGVLSLSLNSVCLILTMRADFLAKCTEREYSGLSALIQTNMVTVTPMTTDEFEQAIVKPAEKVGIAVESELIKTMVEDVKRSPGSLPLLQYTLTELWNRGEVVKFTLTEYSRMGGVKGSLARRADEVYQKELVSDEERAVAKRIFIQLTQLGEGTEDTRRQVLKQNLAKSPEDEQTVAKVIQTLADAKLIVTGEIRAKDEKKTRDAVVDVAHEALIKNWGRLRAWINEDRDFLLTRERVEAAAELWQKEGKPDDRLLVRGRPLAEAEELLAERRSDLSAGLIQFLEASIAIENARRNKERAAERRKLRLTRLAAAVMAILALGSVILGYITNESRLNEKKARQDAQRLTQIADEQRQVAIARRLATEATLLADSSQDADLIDKAAALAVESWRRLKNPTAMAAAQKLLPMLPSYRIFHQKAVKNIAFSPDGNFLATASEDRTVRLIKANTGTEFTRIDHNLPVDWVRFSPDGRFLVTLSSERKGNEAQRNLRLFAAESVREITQIPIDEKDKLSAIFSPDSRLFAVADSDNPLRLFTTEDGREVLQFSDVSSLKDLVYSSNSRYLAGFRRTSSTSTTYLISTTDSGEIIRVAEDDWINSLTFSPDARYLAVASKSGGARLISTADGMEVERFNHGKGATDVAFSPDGKFFATSSRDGTARLFATNTWQEQTRVIHGEEIWHVYFSPDSSFLATWCKPDEKGKVAHLLSTKTNRTVTRIRHADWLQEIIFSPSAEFLATANEDGTASLVATESGREVARLVHRGKVYQAAFSPNSQYLATAASDDAVRLFATATGEELARFLPARQRLDFAFSPNSNMVAIADRDGTAGLFKTSQSFEIACINRKVAIKSLVFNPDGGSLAATGEDGVVRLTTVPSGEELTRLKFKSNPPIRSVYSPDGRFFAAAGKSGNVNKAYLVAARSGRRLAQVVHNKGIPFIKFCKNGAYVAFGSIDGTVFLFETESGHMVTKLENVGIGIQFSPDGRLLKSDSFSTRPARLWATVNGAESKRITPEKDGWVEFSADFRYCILGRRFKGVIKLLDTQSEREIATIRHDKHAWGKFSPNGKFLATASEDGSARMIATESGQELVNLTHHNPLKKMAFSSDSRFMATMSIEGEGYLVESDTAIKAAYFTVKPKQNEILRQAEVVFSPLNRFVAVGIRRAGVKLITTADGNERAQISELGGHFPGPPLWFSSDDRFLAIKENEDIVSLISTDDGRIMARIRHARPVSKVFFSPDASFLATENLDGLVRLLDTATGTEVARHQHPAGWNTSAFSPDSKHLALATKNGIRLYLSNPEYLFDLICAKAGQNLSKSDWSDYIGLNEPWRPTCVNWRNPEPITVDLLTK